MSEHLNLSNYPKDWAISEGYSFLTLGSGVSPSGISFTPNGDTPYMKVDDFNNAGNSTFIKATKLRFDREGSRTPLANINSVIIAKRGAAIFKNRVRISQQIMAVDTNLMTISVGENHCHVYFKYLLEFINLGSIADTISIPQLNNFHLNEATFAFPPLPEQQKIAAILTSVDEVIEKTQAQIDKLKDLKIAMMQELLTNGVGTKQGTGDRDSYIPHTEFKDSPVGRIPKSWDVNALVNYVSFLSYGFTNPMPTAEFGPYMITAKDVHGMKVQYSKARKTTISAYNDLLTRKSRPKVNDILLTKDGTLGRVALVESENCCINQSVAVMTPNEKIIPKFMLYLLASPQYQREMLENAGGSTIKHIYITVVDKMSIAVPPLPEQQQIVNVIDALLNKIDLTEQKLLKTKNTKKALMQDLLTGKVRVKLD